MCTFSRTPEDKFYCVLFLPINSPLKDLVVGSAMHSPSLARRAAAYQAIKQLHQSGEIDNNLMPLGTFLKFFFIIIWLVVFSFITRNPFRKAAKKKAIFLLVALFPSLEPCHLRLFALLFKW